MNNKPKFPPSYRLRVLKVNAPDGSEPGFGQALTANIHQHLYTAELERDNLRDTLAALGVTNAPICICQTVGSETTIVGNPK